MPLNHLKLRTKCFNSFLADDWKTHSLRTLDYDINSKYISIPYTHLKYSGLYTAKQDLYMYCRDAVMDQFKFLKEVINTSSIGFIRGPPGTGKSVTSFAFAMGLDRSKWFITWIHVTTCSPVVVMQFNSNDGGTYQKCGVINQEKLTNLICPVKGKCHIVFVDGIISQDVQQICRSRIECNRDSFRLVFVSSMASQFKIKFEDDLQWNVKRFNIASWTIAEYKSAIKDKIFFDSVKKFLDSSLPVNYVEDEDEPNTEDLINSKYYFAGGSSRYMFVLYTEEVIMSLESALKEVSDLGVVI